MLEGQAGGNQSKREFSLGGILPIIQGGLNLSSFIYEHQLMQQIRNISEAYGNHPIIHREHPAKKILANKEEVRRRVDQVEALVQLDQILGDKVQTVVYWPSGFLKQWEAGERTWERLKQHVYSDTRTVRRGHLRLIYSANRRA